MSRSIRPFFLLALGLLFLLPVQAQRRSKKPAPAPAPSTAFASAFPETQRVFVGPDYWANPLQDWSIVNGRLECRVSALNRNVHLLTRELKPGSGSLDMRVQLGFLQHDTIRARHNYVGFRLGARGQFDDYRDNALFGQGLDVGITAFGELFIGDPAQATALTPMDLHLPLDLRVQVSQQNDSYTVTLEAYDHISGERLEQLTDTLSGDLSGSLALVSHFEGIISRASQPSAWFMGWEASGSKLSAQPDRAYGPILFSQYTLSRGLLKLTAQLAPLGPDDGQTVRLEGRRGDTWELLGEAAIDPDARTATFRLPGWDARQEVPYRLTVALQEKGGPQPHSWTGTIRAEPDGRKPLVVAGFTGNNDLGFPNLDITRNVAAHDPDFLFFSGDQIYEGVGGYGHTTEPVETAMLDYLRKWYLFGWTYRELMKDRPSVCMPDDHDVYHGNIWGAGGIAAPQEGTHFDRQDAGGYKMPPRFVRMVERTQTSHLPDPYDPRPVAQGIGVYFGDLTYGGVSFAILEDRKFKAAPKALLPEARINNGWSQNPDWDAKTQGDVPHAPLLGARQEAFLAQWVQDWSGGARMKVVLSQTIFANVATLPEEELHDKVVPQLRILAADEYAPNDRPVSDMDSNGWPQSGRNRALRLMRQGFAFHLAGDQHLGSFIQYGVEAWGDAGHAFCVPAVSNVWPRRWYPQDESPRRPAGAPRYAGDFEDGFGNKITVVAVSNPTFTGREPARLYDRATGYGIIRLDQQRREIAVACWPRDAGPGAGTQYPGWPVTVTQEAQYGREAVAWLPRLDIRGLAQPVLQVYQEPLGTHVYSLRLPGDRFDPKVFAPGTYTLRIGDPDRQQWQEFRGVKAGPQAGGETLEVRF